MTAIYSDWINSAENRNQIMRNRENGSVLARLSLSRLLRGRRSRLLWHRGRKKMSRWIIGRSHRTQSLWCIKDHYCKTWRHLHHLNIESFKDKSKRNKSKLRIISKFWIIICLKGTTLLSCNFTNTTIIMWNPMMNKLKICNKIRWKMRVWVWFVRIS